MIIIVFGKILNHNNRKADYGYFVYAQVLMRRIQI